MADDLETRVKALERDSVVAQQRLDALTERMNELLAEVDDLRRRARKAY